jgi:hypothetical protein
LNVVELKAEKVQIGQVGAGAKVKLSSAGEISAMVLSMSCPLAGKSADSQSTPGLLLLKTAIY